LAQERAAELSAMELLVFFFIIILIFKLFIYIFSGFPIALANPCFQAKEADRMELQLPLGYFLVFFSNYFNFQFFGFF